MSDPSTTEPLGAHDRGLAREFAVAVLVDVGELGNVGGRVQVEADLLLLSEYVVRLIDQIDRYEADSKKPVCSCRLPLGCEVHG